MADVATRLSSQLQKFRNSAAEVMERQAVNISRGVQALEVSGTAFGLSWLRGRYQKVDAATGKMEFGLLGIDWELWIGLGLHALGFTGLLNPYQEHGHNVADGALASYMTRLGLELGAKSAVKNPPKTMSSGNVYQLYPPNYQYAGAGAQQQRRYA